jgi:hypothetical protein
MLNFVHHNKFFIEYQQKNEDKFPNNGTDPGRPAEPGSVPVPPEFAGTSLFSGTLVTADRRA